MGKCFIKVRIHCLLSLNLAFFLQIMRFSSNCAIGCDLRSIEQNRTIAKYPMAFKPITSHISTNPSKYTISLHYPHIPHTHNKVAVYKSGTGTRGRGHHDACVGTWDLGTRDGGLEDIKYGTRGRVGWGGRDIKNWNTGDAGCE